MAVAGKTLFLAGPPDLMDEEETFQKLKQRDPAVLPLLEAQEAALEGAGGGMLLAVTTADGSTQAEYSLESLPVWDGLAVANGRLLLATTDGRVICMASE